MKLFFFVHLRILIWLSMTCNHVIDLKISCGAYFSFVDAFAFGEIFYRIQHTPQLSSIVLILVPFSAILSWNVLLPATFGIDIVNAVLFFFSLALKKAKKKLEGVY